MLTYEDEARYNRFDIRLDAVDRNDVVSEQIDELLDAMLAGKFDTDFLQQNAKMLAHRLIKEVYDCGVDVGFTYFPSEYEAWQRVKDDFLV